MVIEAEAEVVVKVKVEVVYAEIARVLVVEQISNVTKAANLPLSAASNVFS